MRVDLFITIHKGLRAQLFELAADAARVDVTSTPAVDAIADKVERVLAFLDEHASLEDRFVIPQVRALDPDLADELARDHRALDAVQTEVGLAADAISLADLSQRPLAGAQLARVINHLVAVQLLHMNREETEVNATLWAGLDDATLAGLRAAMAGSLPRERFAEWMAIVRPTLNPTEIAMAATPGTRALGGS
jgi:hypothetical protein